MIKNAIFDLDGTLVDSAGDILGSLERAYYKAAGLENLPLGRSCIGPSLREIIVGVTPDLPRDLVELVVQEYRRLYDQSDFNRSALYEGVYETLCHLKENGIRLFLATNKPAIPTGKLLSKLNIELFEDVITLDLAPGPAAGKEWMLEHLLRVHGLQKEETLFIGDTAGDIIGGRSCGVLTVAFLNGYGDRESLLICQPDRAVERIRDILKLFGLSREAGEKEGR